MGGGYLIHVGGGGGTQLTCHSKKYSIEYVQFIINQLKWQYLPDFDRISNIFT